MASWIRLIVSACGLLWSADANASTNDAANPDKLMVVLRESIGSNKQDTRLIPTGKVKAQLPDGKLVELEMASFEYIGDMHIRFVFDSERSMQSATPEDLKRLNLTPQTALQLAISNIKQTYGEPVAMPWSGGLMQVRGKSPDLDSSYFLDDAFWAKLLKRFPEGIVAAVIRREGLLFAPLSDSSAVRMLQSRIIDLHASSGSMRISSALYLFKDNHWTVFQAPQSVAR